MVVRVSSRVGSLPTLSPYQTIRWVGSEINANGTCERELELEQPQRHAAVNGSAVSSKEGLG